MWSREEVHSTVLKHEKGEGEEMKIGRESSLNLVLSSEFTKPLLFNVSLWWPHIAPQKSML